MSHKGPVKYVIRLWTLEALSNVHLPVKGLRLRRQSTIARRSALDSIYSALSCRLVGKTLKRRAGPGGAYLLPRARRAWRLTRSPGGRSQTGPETRKTPTLPHATLGWNHHGFEAPPAHSLGDGLTAHGGDRENRRECRHVQLPHFRLRPSYVSYAVAVTLGTTGRPGSHLRGRPFRPRSGWPQRTYLTAVVWLDRL